MNNLNSHNRITRNINNHRKCRFSGKPPRYIDANNSISRGQKLFSNHFMENFNVENQIFVLFRIARTFYVSVYIESWKYYDYICIFLFIIILNYLSFNQTWWLSNLFMKHFQSFLEVYGFLISKTRWRITLNFKNRLNLNLLNDFS